MSPDFASSVNNLVPFLVFVGLFVFFLLIFGSPLSIQDINYSLMMWGAVFFFKSRICLEPRSPALQADSLPAEPQGKPENTAVGNLSLLQRIFLTQESNQGLLHCRWILYRLIFQGSPQMKVQESSFCKTFPVIFENQCREQSRRIKIPFVRMEITVTPCDFKKC